MCRSLTAAILRIFIRGSYDRSYATITKLNVPPYTFGSFAQGTDKLFLAKEGERYGTFYGRKFVNGCTELPARSRRPVDREWISRRTTTAISCGSEPVNAPDRRHHAQSVAVAADQIHSPFYSQRAPRATPARCITSVDVNWGMPIDHAGFHGWRSAAADGQRPAKYRYAISQTFRFKNLQLMPSSMRRLAVAFTTRAAAGHSSISSPVMMSRPAGLSRMRTRLGITTARDRRTTVPGSADSTTSWDRTQHGRGRQLQEAA